MKVKEKNNVIVLKKSSELIADFVDKINEQLHICKDKNVIIDFEDVTLRPADILLFENIAAHQLEQKKSFVIIADIDFDEIDDNIIVVPTLQEGFDIIEMEEIERDLGF